MNRFDKFAARASGVVSHAAFFLACVAMVVLWAPSILFIHNLDTWQLIINTSTTIITFLMVAILENSTQQFENATNAKLDTILKGLSELHETNSELLDNMIGAEESIGAKKPPADVE